MNKILVYSGDPSGTFCIELDKSGWNVTPTNDLKISDIVIYTDKMVFNKNKIGKVKIAWLFDSDPAHKPQLYNYIVQNYKEFDYVITWDKELLAVDNRFVYLPYGNVPIAIDQFVMYPKTKLLSIIASEKTFLIGHKLRHEVIAKYGNKMDLYGRGYNPIDSLLHALKDYKFSICIENVQRDWGFSEKVVTPILCGTIPIYWGCDLSKFFDIRGIIIFNNISEIPDIIDSLTDEKYNDMLPYALDNFEKAKKYRRNEDNLFELLVKLNVLRDET